MVKNSKINTLVILAGGLGTRLAEETQKKPKPMVKNWIKTNNLAYYTTLQILWI